MKHLELVCGPHALSPRRRLQTRLFLAVRRRIYTSASCSTAWARGCNPEAPVVLFFIFGLCIIQRMDPTLAALVRLPDEIIVSVLALLPPAHIEVLLHYAPLRPLVIDTYYAHELHVILSPTRRPHHCDPDPQRRQLIDFDYIEFDEFWRANPAVAPHRLVIFAGGDFGPLETLLATHRRRLAALAELHLHIERYEPTARDLASIAAFANVTKLQFTQTPLTLLAHPPHNAFLATLPNLEQLVLLGHNIKDWSAIALPPRLRHLDVLWNDEVRINSMVLPPSVTDLYWNQSGVRAVPRRLAPHLATLMLTYNDISAVEVAHLPPTLETLDLLYNCVAHFGAGRWPPMLKSLLLSHNLINNDALAELARCEMPATLKILKLDDNPFTTLEHPLPDTLEYLDVSHTRLHTLGPSFEFPALLESLDLSSSEHLVFARVRFPARLRHLNLDGCRLDSLHYFEWPSSLWRLLLCGNRLRDLTLCADWARLTALKHLELYFNQIASLQGWQPPPNLAHLDLSKNELTLLAGPLFSHPHTHLDTIKLDTNNIAHLGSDLCLPRRLRTLSLRDNALAGECTVPPAMTMGALENLDLSDNSITRLRWHLQPHPSALRALDLTRNLILKTGKSTAAIAQFYSDLEVALKIRCTKHKASVNSLHEFTREPIVALSVATSVA